MKLRFGKIENRNFGDELNYYLLKELLPEYHIVNYRDLLHFGQKNYIIIGSVIEDFSNKNSIIWGGGGIYGKDFKMLAKPKSILAVRGKLSRNYLLSEGILCPEVYGDPALLLPYIYPCKNKVKKHKVGIIPHVTELQSKETQMLLKSIPDSVLIEFSGYTNWKDVIEKINECERVLSSSLHGLIISDAYRIPNLWYRLKDSRIKGGLFKYLDYFSSVNRTETSPLTFDYNNVDMTFIYKHFELYKYIDFDYSQLIKVCPFEAFKKEFMRRINS